MAVKGFLCRWIRILSLSHTPFLSISATTTPTNKSIRNRKGKENNAIRRMHLIARASTVLPTLWHSLGGERKNGSSRNPRSISIFLLTRLILFPPWS
jgi:hypothetical protein